MLAVTNNTLPISKNPGQKALAIDDAYLVRISPIWNRPPTIDANAWRAVVNAQPVAVTCRDTLISSVLSLDWKISVRDSNMQEEYANTAKYYTRLLEKAGYGSDLDYTSHIEWIAGDLLDTPFGGMSEIGRDGDKPTGRVKWIEPLDAATLYPTLNFQFPVVQYYMGREVGFPRHAVARTYMRPRTRIEYKGWGIAPPETAYLAFDMLARGDNYYANLLLDIPTAGILDLGDMEKDSALEWVNAYRSLLANGGNSSFKIPVLYEHQNEVKFVPFGKVPNDIMFDRITLKYAALIAASYGMSLSDIGISPTTNGGETLAGSIRSERKTRKTGFARLKKKLKFYFEQILPPYLQFSWVDYDDEVNIALGRARQANANAFKMLSDAGFISPKEGRQQLIADGMFTISMPEEPPAKPKQPKVSTPVMLPKENMPVAPSMGGHGDIKASYLDRVDFQVVKAVTSELLAEFFPQLQEVREGFGEDGLFEARSIVEDQIIPELHRVTKPNWLVIEGVESGALEIAESVIEKFILLKLKDELLSDSVDAIDFSDNIVYDSILNTVSESLKENLDEIVQTSIETYSEVKEK